MCLPLQMAHDGFGDLTCTLQGERNPLEELFHTSHCVINIFKASELRVTTSLYLPTVSLAMFPSERSRGKISLRAGQDSHALSMAIILNKDGSIDQSNIHYSVAD
jgi:Exoribonuclease R